MTVKESVGESCGRIGSSRRIRHLLTCTHYDEGIPHYGDWGVYGLPLEGGPGSLIITVYAIGDGSCVEQTIEVNFINKPNCRDCGDDREDCIPDMLRHVEPLIHQGITLNEDLDTVDVFANGVLERYSIPLPP